MIVSAYLVSVALINFDDSNIFNVSYLASTRGILASDYCMFDNFTEYFTLSRNGSVIDISHFIRMIKCHMCLIWTYDSQISYV